MINILQIIDDKNMGIREKLIKRIMIYGMFLSLLAIIEVLLMTSTYYTVIPLGFLFLSLAVAHLLSIKKNNMDMVAVIIQFTAIYISFPAVFFLSGGIEGGSAVWYVLGIFYSISVFKGIRMYVYTGITVIIYSLSYYVGVKYPQLILYNDSKTEVYSDSLFAVLFVGILLGIVLKAQIKYYDQARLTAVEQKEEIERLSYSRNAFLANMTNEIRTPINTIIGLNEVILRDDSVSEEMLENISASQSSSKMLLSLINDIIDISRIENGTMVFDKTEYSTKAFFEDIVDIIKGRIEEKSLDFKVDIDYEIPSLLYGDDKRIKQIVINLLTNAVKYTRHGSVTLEARIEKIGEEWCKLIISVIDTGSGIKAEKLSTLFDSLASNNDDDELRIQGTGLGLSISQRLIHLMGGEITVDSIYTKGSTFTMILEQKIVSDKPLGNINFLSLSKNRDKYRQSFEAPEARVLIVDDNEMNRMVVSKLLKDTKLQIDMASSGEECLKLTQLKFYHLILMDYLMPDMDGRQTLDMIRKQENGLCKNSPVIAMTADATLASTSNYVTMGFDAVLEKPVRGVELESEIIHFLPEDIIEYQIQAPTDSESNFRISKEKHKKKKILITTECISDISDEVCEQLDIRRIFLYVNIGDNRFCDTKEIDSNTISSIIESGQYEISAEAATVEDYEKFFAECIYEADEVVHISLGSGMGVSYKRAMEAANGFDHVHVVDSKNLTGGMGIIVLRCAQMASEGFTYKEIIEEANRVAENITCKILLPSVEHFYKYGYAGYGSYLFNKIFRFHPVIVTKNNKLSISSFKIGNLEAATQKFVSKFLLSNKNISNEIIYITYAGIPVKLQEEIKSELKKSGKFINYFVEKSSVSNACFAGYGTVTVAFYVEK